MSRVNKLKDHKPKLNVNGTDIKSYDRSPCGVLILTMLFTYQVIISNICNKSSQQLG